MLIVTGLGRSGTSVLTKFYDKLGYRTTTEEKTWWSDEVDAGYECGDFYRIVAEVNRCIDLNIFTPKDLKQRIKEYDCDVVKSIDFAYQKGEVLRRFAEVRDDFSVAYCFRDPAKIIASRRSKLPKRPTFVDKRRKLQPHVFYEDFLHFIEVVHQTKTDCVILLFPDSFNGFYEINEKLGNLLCAPFPKTLGEVKEVWREVYNPEMVHFG